MVEIRRVVLDVLKPHQPNALEFCTQLAELGEGYRVNLTVLEMDEMTQTLRLLVEADNVDFAGIQEVINQMGASLHSIDEVEVVNRSDSPS